MRDTPELVRPRPIIKLVALLFISAIDIVLFLFITLKFGQIFEDSNYGRPLPGLTQFFMDNHVGLVLLVLGWSMVAGIAVWQRYRLADVVIGFGLLLFIALIPILIIALLMPMDGP